MNTDRHRLRRENKYLFLSVFICGQFSLPALFIGCFNVEYYLEIVGQFRDRQPQIVPAQGAADAWFFEPAWLKTGTSVISDKNSEYFV
jgi:hypothetical protein